MENDNSTNEIRVFAMSTNIRLESAAVKQKMIKNCWATFLGQEMWKV